MSRFKKILRAIAIVALLMPIPVALFVSHDSPCGEAPLLASETPPMKAAVHRCYGSSDLVKIEDLAKPVPEANQVLVKVLAASVNPLDWHYLHGMPYIGRIEMGTGAPTNPRLGVDFAGVVEAVGKDVTRYKVGDEVFGGRFGSLAEYVVVREAGSIAHKPSNVSFEQAAAVPVAAITALQAVRDEGHVGAGQKVLVNGASGGVGTYAVQFAKVLGAEVTAVCSARNADLVRGIGADHVIDYAKEDYTAGAVKYDVIIDNVATHGLLDNRRVLADNGNYVIVGGAGKAEDGKWLGPMTVPLKALFLKPFVKQKMAFFLADLNPKDLAQVAEWMEQGKVKSVIDRTYPLAETPAALKYLEEGHARGKVVIRMDEANVAQH